MWRLSGVRWQGLGLGWSVWVARGFEATRVLGCEGFESWAVWVALGSGVTRGLGRTRVRGRKGFRSRRI